MVNSYLMFDDIKYEVMHKPEPLKQTGRKNIHVQASVFERLCIYWIIVNTRWVVVVVVVAAVVIVVFVISSKDTYSFFVHCRLFRVVQRLQIIVFIGRNSVQISTKMLFTDSPDIKERAFVS